MQDWLASSTRNAIATGHHPAWLCVIDFYSLESVLNDFGYYPRQHYVRHHQKLAATPFRGISP
jgi:hypothetical protein